MANSIRIEILNLDEVKKAIALRPEMARAVADAALEAASKVILDLAKSNAPGPGLDMEKTGEAEYSVGPLKSKFYYGFFELGTSAHLVLPRGKKALKWGDTFAAASHPGGIAAQPFLRPAIDEGKDKAGAAAGEVWKKAIE
jgi:HK97 gp10 family phage protein